MSTEILQLIGFLWIAGSFITCVLFVVWPLAAAAIRDLIQAFYGSHNEPMKQQAVILQFRSRVRGGRVNG